jgi:hypothetical protein
MKKLLICLMLPILFVIGFAQRSVGLKTTTVSTQPRIALIIGNSNYKQKSDFLPNSLNDARLLEKTLLNLGFEVLVGFDVDKTKMKELIRDFADRLEQQKAVGVFYYAGHGVAVNGSNYLIPIDAEFKTEDEVDDDAISIKFLLDKMEQAQNPLNILFLDACRNNPFARRWRKIRDQSGAGGLTKIETQGSMIFYSTEYGKTAIDGNGQNSPFSKSLVENMVKPDVEFEKMFRQVINDVFSETSGEQKPWKEGSYSGEDFYFNPTKNPPKPKPTSTVTPKPITTITPTPITKPNSSIDSSRSYIGKTCYYYAKSSRRALNGPDSATGFNGNILKGWLSNGPEVVVVNEETGRDGKVYLEVSVNNFVVGWFAARLLTCR